MLARIDPDRIAQIVTNVVGNALRACDEGDRIVVHCRSTGELAEVVVTDTGRGLRAEDLDRVFERFYRAEPTRERASTGIGLTISRGLARAHGGDLRAASAGLGQGATSRSPCPWTREPPCLPGGTAYPRGYSRGMTTAAALALAARACGRRPPDDESFGLGAVLDAFVRAGADVRVLCLTRGEASTLGGDLADLGAVRERELNAAAADLGITEAMLGSWPDGALDAAPRSEVVAQILAAIDEHAIDGLVVFDPSGVTGHPDHRAATEAATTAGRERCAVLA